MSGPTESYWLECANVVLSAVTLVLLYYYIFKRILFLAIRYMVDLIPSSGRLSRNDLIYVSQMIMLAATHLIFVFVIAGLINVNLRSLFSTSDITGACIVGVFLGLGEMGCAALLCRLLIEGLMSWRSREKGSVEWWVVGAKAGWIRHHLRTVQLLPIPIALSVIAIQVTAEETMFRGLLLELLSPLGAFYAASISVALFTVIQCLHMPNWQSAMFPVVGGLVMGVVNTYLMAQYQNITPLAISHVVFFAFAVL